MNMQLFPKIVQRLPDSWRDNINGQPRVINKLLALREAVQNANQFSATEIMIQRGLTPMGDADVVFSNALSFESKDAIKNLVFSPGVSANEGGRFGSGLIHSGSYTASNPDLIVCSKTKKDGFAAIQADPEFVMENRFRLADVSKKAEECIRDNFCKSDKFTVFVMFKSDPSSPSSGKRGERILQMEDGLALSLMSGNKQGANIFLVPERLSVGEVRRSVLNYRDYMEEFCERSIEREGNITVNFENDTFELKVRVRVRFCNGDNPVDADGKKIRIIGRIRDGEKKGSHQPIPALQEFLTFSCFAEMHSRFETNASAFFPIPNFKDINLFCPKSWKKGTKTCFFIVEHDIIDVISHKRLEDDSEYSPTGDIATPLYEFYRLLKIQATFLATAKECKDVIRESFNVLTAQDKAEIARYLPEQNDQDKWAKLKEKRICNVPNFRTLLNRQGEVQKELHCDETFFLLMNNLKGEPISAEEITPLGHTRGYVFTSYNRQSMQEDFPEAYKAMLVFEKQEKCVFSPIKLRVGSYNNPSTTREWHPEMSPSRAMKIGYLSASGSFASFINGDMPKKQNNKINQNLKSKEKENNSRSYLGEDHKYFIVITFSGREPRLNKNHPFIKECFYPTSPQLMAHQEKLFDELHRLSRNQQRALLLMDYSKFLLQKCEMISEKIGEDFDSDDGEKIVVNEFIYAELSDPESKLYEIVQKLRDCLNKIQFHGEAREETEVVTEETNQDKYQSCFDSVEV